MNSSNNRKNHCNNLLFVYAISTVFFTVSFFLFGFFPLNSLKDNDKLASMNDLPKSINKTLLNSNILYKPLVKKIVIMIIDSLRWDFVSTKSDRIHNTMIFTNRLLEKNFGRLLQVKVNNPTVTMPRIKAITTGSVSNYIDVILNLGETRVSSDNILLQAKNHGHKLIFYGDDTWLQMFTNIFHRSEGTSSFFVNDFVQVCINNIFIRFFFSVDNVDNNVTRNIYSELENNNDWSIMILHYLGLDHIGHVYGPKSPLIQSKLEEMDKIIEDISSKVIEWNKQNVESLFIICGDHGMKNSGGHGGATPEETLVPLIIIGGNYNENHNNLNYKMINQIDQIDITTTLAVILGLPLPYLNIGVVSLNMINYNLSSAQKLYILYYNGRQVLNHFKKLSNFHSKQCYLNYLKAVKLHNEWINSSNNESNFDNTVSEKIITLYLESLKDMKNLLVQSIIQYNISLITIAIVLTIQVFFIIINFNNSINKVFLLKKFFYYWSFSVASWFSLNYILINFINDIENSLKFNDLPIAFILIIFILFNLNVYLMCTRTVFPFKLSIFWTSSKFSCSFSIFMLYLAVGLHAASLGSSSFIEEEHQTWYFYWTTSLVIILIYCIKQRSKNITKENSNNIKIIFLLILHRFLRKLNSTGNKYANLPDISGWLKESKYSDIYMTLFVIIALGLILYVLLFIVKNDEKNKLKQKKDKLLFYSFTLLCIYLRHASEKNIYTLPFYPQSRGIREVEIFWVVCTFYLIYSIKNIIFYPKNTYKILINQLFYLSLQYWIIISAILHRPYNIILLPIQLITQIIISNFLINTTDNLKVLTFTSYCIGNVFYFYQGNSNSLATIDVAASCVGLETYRIYIAALFICINTFSSPVLAYLILVFKITLDDTSNTIEFFQKVHFVNRQYAIFKLFSFITYTIIISIERHHLFVWSVFAPKLLYETAHCVVIFSIIYFVEIAIIVIKKIYKV
ncbi:GSCOCG00009347001-RA-CDS [Cotesia congregata]|nr:GSCOCG00009347001-RA-CDS [Cotesia congregata]